MAISHPAIQEHWSVRVVSYRLADSLAILFGWLIAANHSETPVGQKHAIAALATTIAYHVAAEITGMYRNWRGVKADREISCGIVTWLFTLPPVILLGLFVGLVPSVSNLFFTRWLLTTLCVMTATRLILRRTQTLLRARGVNTRGYAVVGCNELGEILVQNIKDSPELGLKLVGFYDDRSIDRSQSHDLDDAAEMRIGDIDTLVREAREGKINMIYITFPMRAEDRIRSVLARLSDTTASVYIVPDFFVFQLLCSRWTIIGGLPSVSVFENPLYGVDGFVKRMLDVAVAVCLLILLALPMLLIAGFIRHGSPGPIFFRQKRYGLDGKEILVWKFRSMTVCDNGDRIEQARPNDPRVTRIGAILRRTSLDELPQLFNVLMGTMSLVGPRPHASAHNELYRSQIQGYMLRHKVKPGITGLAQVNGYRGETDTLEKMEKRVECDHRYIREWSLWMDLKILLKTLLIVFKPQNAY